MSKLNLELVKANGCELLFRDKNLWVSVCDNTYEPTFGIYFGDVENYPEIDIDDIFDMPNLYASDYVSFKSQESQKQYVLKEYGINIENYYTRY